MEDSPSDIIFCLNTFMSVTVSLKGSKHLKMTINMGLRTQLNSMTAEVSSFKLRNN